MADMPREIQHARRTLRGIEPPPGARARVLRRLSDQIRKPARGRSPVSPWVLAAALPVLLAATASAFGLRHALRASWRASDSASLSASASSSQAARPSALPPRGAAAGRAVDLPTTAREVPASELLPPALDTADSPTLLAPAPEGSPPGAAPSATSAPTSTAPALTNGQTQGTAATNGQTQGTAATNGHSPGKAAASAARPKATSPEVAELSAQVVAYQEAVGEIPHDPTRALAGLVAFRSRWPQSTLAHEVDLRIVQTLMALGRDRDARAEAQAFLVRHPDSPRRADLERIAASSASPATKQ